MSTPQHGAVIQPCRYKTGKILGAGSYSVVKECVHIETGRYYAAKVINKRLMQGREHMVRSITTLFLFRLRIRRKVARIADDMVRLR
jgi:serine/threonine protein kinase